MGRMEHLDAESLAAWQDGGLDASARAAAEAHLADCAKCRDRLGAQVRAAAGREGSGAEVSGSIGAPRDRSGLRGRLAAAAVGALILGAGAWWALDRAPAERASIPGGREAAPLTPAPAAGGALAEGDRATRAEDAARPGATARSTDPSRPAHARLDAPPGDVAGTGPGAPAGGQDVEPELLALRGGARELAGKTFRLRGDEWVDDAWTAPPGRAPIPLIRGTAAWRTALAERPALARFAEVGPRVLVVLDSLAFRILPAP